VIWALRPRRSPPPAASRPVLVSLLLSLATSLHAHSTASQFATRARPGGSVH
jgi:hypothetical protein